jgi:putative heme-binding domain-containing protein
MWMKCASVVILVATASLAQSTYSSGDIETGAQLFRASCAICHGPEGDIVPGIDFAHGKFKRASSDTDIIEIITHGIPGTSMPANDDFSEPELATIVAYVRSMASTARGASSAGDGSRGRALFEGKGGCLNCHRAGGEGSRTGPDLTEIGRFRRGFELEQSLLEPDAEILPQNRFVRVVTANGTSITGRILNHDGFTVQLIDTQERLRSFLKSELREFSFENKSPMPSYKNTLTPDEVADLVSYLVSLKGD